MRKRKRCQNKDCGVLFDPCPQVPGQMYCSKKECQQVRKKEWNRKKIATDSDYREARQAAQRKWRKKNPNYWKEYRDRHPDYVKSNGEQQKIRNRNRSNFLPLPEIAKTDESIPVNRILTGRYKIIPIRPVYVAKTDECIVDIIAVSG